MSSLAVVVDYGWGNLQSVVQAASTAAPPGVQVLRSSAPEDVSRADRLIVPGQGAFRDTSLNLHGTALGESILERMRAGTPYFGICMGLQILFEGSEESPGSPGFGWFKGSVQKLLGGGSIKIPHMGWNDVSPAPHGRDGAALIEPGEAYFLHSYHFRPEQGRDIAAMTDHGGGLVAAVARDNVLGVQFHPEKSQAYGIALLERFLEWNP